MLQRAHLLVALQAVRVDAAPVAGDERRQHAGHNEGGEVQEEVGDLRCKGGVGGDAVDDGHEEQRVAGDGLYEGVAVRARAGNAAGAAGR